MEEKKNIITIIKESFKELGETLAAFIRAPRALWGVNVPYVLEGLCYFGILTILGKYCSENVALSDLHAGWVYGGVTGGITFAMLILGGMTDKIGVRNSLLLALSGMVAGRILVSLSGTLPLDSGVGSPMFFIMLIGLLLMVTSYGLYQPAAYAGVKRYTTPKTAAMGYAVVYGLMNLGAFFSGPIASLMRQSFETTFPPNGLTAVFWSFTAITIAAVLATFFILTPKVDKSAVERVAREAQAMPKGETEEKTESPHETVHVNNIPVIAYTLVTVATIFALFLFPAAQTPTGKIILMILASLMAIVTGWEFLRHRPEHPFRDIRFVFFISILIPVQTLFAHNWLTIPYYLDRAFTGSWVSDYFEVLSNLNPIIIFIITPIIAGLTARANVYKMMIIGTFVMAAPTFLLAVGPNAGLFIVYILIMSVGEAMWQPRFLQWIAEIAPEGKTGAYMGIGQMPWFLTKLLTSLYSGWFVTNYIPKPGSGLVPRTGEMWIIYGVIAMISPIALLLAKNWMKKSMK